jgi:outer membrane lipoprotein-sorting protein
MSRSCPVLLRIGSGPLRLRTGRGNDPVGMSVAPPFSSSSEPSPLRASVSASTRRRALRWLAPVGAVGVVALVASGVLSADAKPNLPRQTAAQLLASVGDSKVAGFSGTVVSKSSLGLPELPQLGGSNSSAGVLGMLTGSHTARVWYGGETKQRVALLDSLGEQDVFRNGRDVWQWNSDNRTATHSLLPADAGQSTPTMVPTLTPDQAAQQALRLIDPSTTVNTDRTGTVAGRSTYTLVLTPKDARSRVGSVRISVDGKTRVPLSVQVFSRNSDRAAIDVSFTRVDFAVPDNDFFTFRPPTGVVPKETPLGGMANGIHPGPLGAPSSGGNVTSMGSGWTTIAKVTGVPSIAALGKQDGQATALLGSLPRVSGTWGTGRLFTSTLLTALITDDGRAYVGPVDPDLLYKAAVGK